MNYGIMFVRSMGGIPEKLYDWNVLPTLLVMLT